MNPAEILTVGKSTQVSGPKPGHSTNDEAGESPQDEFGALLDELGTPEDEQKAALPGKTPKGPPVDIIPDAPVLTGKPAADISGGAGKPASDAEIVPEEKVAAVAGAKAQVETADVSPGTVTAPLLNQVKPTDHVTPIVAENNVPRTGRMPDEPADGRHPADLAGPAKGPERADKPEQAAVVNPVHRNMPQALEPGSSRQPAVQPNVDAVVSAANEPEKAPGNISGPATAIPVGVDQAEKSAAVEIAAQQVTDRAEKIVPRTEQAAKIEGPVPKAAQPTYAEAPELPASPADMKNNPAQTQRADTPGNPAVQEASAKETPVNPERDIPQKPDVQTSAPPRTETARFDQFGADGGLRTQDTAIHEWRLSGLNATSGARAETAMAQPGRVSSVPEQISVAMARVGDAGKVEIRLDPPELGRVEIHIRTSDEGVRAVVMAERPETQDLLRRHAALLERDLAESGFEDISLEFTAGNDPGTDEAPDERNEMQEWSSASSGIQEQATREVRTPAASGLDIRI